MFHEDEVKVDEFDWEAAEDEEYTEEMELSMPVSEESETTTTKHDISDLTSIEEKLAMKHYQK